MERQKTAKKRPLSSTREEEADREERRQEDDDEERRGPAGPERDATDEEVEEFYAIIRRIHLAGGAGRGRRVARKGEDGAAQWRPEFTLEDFAVAKVVEADGHGGGASADAAVANGGDRSRPALDLNAEPEQDGAS